MAIDRFMKGPDIAISQLSEGNLDAAMAALWAPEELTPHEREQDWRKRWGIDKGPLSILFKNITNPIIASSIFLSMKFPVASWKELMKVSDKLGGYAASLMPMLWRFRSAHANFRGTEVPEVLDNLQAAFSEFMHKPYKGLIDDLSAYEKAAGPLTRRDQTLLSLWIGGAHKNSTVGGGGILAPALESYMSKPLRELARKAKGRLGEAWELNYGTPEKRERVVRALTAAGKLSKGDDALLSAMEWAKVPNKIEDYFPQVIIRDLDDLKVIKARVLGGGDPKAYEARARKRAGAVAGPQDQLREGAMIPDLMALEQVKDVLDPAVVAKLGSNVRGRFMDRMGRVLGPEAQARLSKLTDAEITSPEAWRKVLSDEDFITAVEMGPEALPRQYSLSFSDVMSQYLKSSAHTYSWSSIGSGVKEGGRDLSNGEALVGITTRLKGLEPSPDNAMAIHRGHMLESKYIPMALGRLPASDAFARNARDARVTRSLELLLNNKTVRDLMGEDLTRYFTKSLLESDKSITGQLSGAMASYFYNTTLSANVASPLQNLFQSLPVASLVGLRSWTGGVASVAKKAEGYFRARFRGLPHEEALAAGFPEFTKAGLSASPIADEALQRGLSNIVDLVERDPLVMGASKLKGGINKINQAMMSLFSTTEVANRLIAFESGLNLAARGGAKADEAIRFGRWVVNETQFPTGLANTPYAAIGKGPLARQLLQFPARMLEYVTGTAITAGGAQKSLFGSGYNPGTLARNVAASAIMYEAASEYFDEDLSGMLLPGMIPLPTEGQPLAPLPVVPPMIAVAASLGIDMAAGTTEYTRRALPLLVPGGVGAARAIGMIPGGEDVSKFIGRPFADYEQPAPDGRIAVYTGDGRFRGYFTQWEVVRMGLGVKPASARKEQELVQMLIKNRDHIRGYRTQYLTAVSKNDIRTAQDVQATFKQRYGVPLTVSEKDIKSAHTRRFMPRIESVLRTLPAGELRNQYIQMVSQTLGQNPELFLGVPPQSMGVPFSRSLQDRFPGPDAIEGSLPPLAPFLNQQSGPAPTNDLSPVGGSFF